MRGGQARWVPWLAIAMGIALIAAALVSLRAASRPVGQAVSAERVDLAPPGATVRAANSFGPDVGEPPTLASSADGDRTVGAVLADLEDYWSAELGADGGPGFAAPSGGYVSMDSTAATGSALCIGEPSQVAGNTFYCPQGDGIVFDSASLVPVLLGRYGTAGLAASFAHEFGHAVQARIGPTQQERQRDPERYPSILIEAQADCDAGAFLASASSGQTQRLHLPAASLLRAVAPLLDFRDPATLSPTSSTAHGLGLDRLSFVLKGFRGGSAACPAMTADDLSVTLGRSGVTTSPPSTLPRYPSNRAAEAAAAASVTDFADQLSPAVTIRAPVADQADRRAAAPLGQFASGAAVALDAGRQITGSSAGAACFTGAWTASAFGRAGVDELGSWPTDADEAMDLVRTRPGAQFDDLAAFADGFHQGYGACP